MSSLQIFRTTFVAILVPILLITSSVRIVVDFTGFYSFEFDRSRISQYTGIDKQELMQVSRRIQDYFHDDNELLVVPGQIHGRFFENIFNQKEVQHMKDVKILFNGVSLLQYMSSIVLAFLVLGQILFRGINGLQESINSIVWGAFATLLLILIASFGVLLSFDRLFRLFHLLSFANDLWSLDPRHDYLVAIFNQKFFFHASLLVAIFSIVGAFILMGTKYFLDYLIKRLRNSENH